MSKTQILFLEEKINNIQKGGRTDLYVALKEVVMKH
jgi:hypothetical protein